MANKDSKKTVEALTHDEARRKHIPTAEYQSVMRKEEEQPVRVAYERGAAGRSALIDRNGRTFAYLLEGNRVRETPVRVGATFPFRTPPLTTPPPGATFEKRGVNKGEVLFICYR